MKTWPPKTKENVCTLILGSIFVKSKHIQRFCEGFHTFCPNFHRFCPDFKEFYPDFHQIKSFGGALEPPPPTLVLYCIIDKLDTFLLSMWKDQARSQEYLHETPELRSNVYNGFCSKVWTTAQRIGSCVQNRLLVRRMGGIGGCSGSSRIRRWHNGKMGRQHLLEHSTRVWKHGGP